MHTVILLYELLRLEDTDAELLLAAPAGVLQRAHRGGQRRREAEAAAEGERGTRSAIDDPTKGASDLVSG